MRHQRRADTAARGPEVARPALGVKAEHVVRQQPLVDRVAPLTRQHAPVGRPRDVHEVSEQGIRPCLADEPWREIQVVVVEKHERIGFVVQLGNNG